MSPTEAYPAERLMEDVLDECTRRMRAIDDEIARLREEREEVEERATKARFALLRKCEEALGLFTHQLNADADEPMNTSVQERTQMPSSNAAPDAIKKATGEW